MIARQALVSAPSAGTLPQVVAQSVATIALGLLAASGIAKLVDPTPTTGAMRSARLPSSHLLTYALGTLELFFAAAALVLGGIYTLGAAILYAAFALFTFAALRNRIPLQSCGCFGRDDTPPTTMHVGFNIISASALVALPVLGLDPIPWDLDAVPLTLFLGFAIIGVYVSYLMLSTLPQLTSATQR